ncbi:MAG: alanine racemase [Deltaproteobacteria bacterium]|jgi:alanine racemase|nr:alanine racemase [Deltaproteobacteria bacterium]
MPLVTRSEDFNDVVINLSNLVNNYKVLSEFAQRPLMCVIKGDAYGHGLVDCARALVDAGATSFGVLDVTEGETLRKAGIRNPEIYVLSGLDTELMVARAINNRLTIYSYSMDELALLGSQARRSSSPLNVVLKIDSGMGRLGVPWHQADDFIKKALEFSSLKVVGLATHLATVGDKESVTQLEHFWDFCTKAEYLLNTPLQNSALSGAGILAHPRYPDGLSRPGLILYGVPPLVDLDRTYLLPAPWLNSPKAPVFRVSSEKVAQVLSSLKPVMRVTSRVIQVKSLRKGDTVSYERTYTAPNTTKIAIVPFGFVHGFDINLSGRTHALIRGQFARQIGKICMNLSVFEVKDIPGVATGDEVVFLGSQKDKNLDAYLEFEGRTEHPHQVLCLYGRLNVRRCIRS